MGCQQAHRAGREGLNPASSASGMTCRWSIGRDNRTSGKANEISTGFFLHRPDVPEDGSHVVIEAGRMRVARRPHL